MNHQRPVKSASRTLLYCDHCARTTWAELTPGLATCSECARVRINTETIRRSTEIKEE